MSDERKKRVGTAIAGSKKRETRSKAKVRTVARGDTLHVIIDETGGVAPGDTIQATTVEIPTTGSVNDSADQIETELRALGMSEPTVAEATRSFREASLMEMIEDFPTRTRAYQDKFLASLEDTGPALAEISRTLEMRRGQGVTKEKK
jgi:hypothetical protein